MLSVFRRLVFFGLIPALVFSAHLLPVTAYSNTKTINSIIVYKHVDGEPSKYVFILDNKPPYYKIIKDGLILALGGFDYSGALNYTGRTIQQPIKLKSKDHDIGFDIEGDYRWNTIDFVGFRFPKTNTILIHGEKFDLNSEKDSIAFIHTFKKLKSKIVASRLHTFILAEFEGSIKQFNRDGSHYYIPYAVDGRQHDRPALSAYAVPYNPIVMARHKIKVQIAGTVKEKSKWILYPKLVIGRAENEKGKQLLEKWLRKKSKSWFEDYQWFPLKGKEAKGYDGVSIVGYADISSKNANNRAAIENKAKRIAKLKTIVRHSAPSLKSIDTKYFRKFYIDPDAVEHFKLPFSTIKVDIDPIKSWRGNTKGATMMVTFGDKTITEKIYTASNFHHFKYFLKNKGGYVQFTYFGNNNGSFKAVVY